MESNKDCHLEKKLQLLCSIFPDASFHRDEIINQLLLESDTTLELIQRIKKEYLYEGNTLNHTSDEQVMSLGMLRLYSSLSYFLPEDLKLRAYNNIVNVIENDQGVLKHLELSDKKEIFKSFFM